MNEIIQGSNSPIILELDRLLDVASITEAVAQLTQVLPIKTWVKEDMTFETKDNVTLVVLPLKQSETMELKAYYIPVSIEFKYRIADNVYQTTRAWFRVCERHNKDILGDDVVGAKEIKPVPINVITETIVVDGGTGVSDHALLENLDFAKSGHTGFQSQLNDIQLANINGVNLYDAKPCRIIAHRGKGVLDGMPENVIESYEFIGAFGMWGAECDLNETSDGHFVLMHDTTVDRTTNGTGSVALMTLEEIKALEVNEINAYATNGKIIRVPTIEEFLLTCKKYNLYPYIEMKNIQYGSITRLIDIIKSYVGYDFVLLTFSSGRLEVARNYDEFINLEFAGAYPTEEHITMMKEKNYSFTMQASLYDEALATKLNENEITMSAYNITSGQQILNLMNLGVKNFTADKFIDYSNQRVTEQIERKICNGYLGNWSSVGQQNVFTDTTFVGFGTNRAHSDVFSVLGTTHFMRVNTEDTVYLATATFFDVNGDRLPDTGWRGQGAVTVVPPLAAYCSIYLKRTDDAVISVDELAYNEAIKFIFWHKNQMMV